MQNVPVWLKPVGFVARSIGRLVAFVECIFSRQQPLASGPIMATLDDYVANSRRVMPGAMADFDAGRAKFHRNNGS